MYKQPVDDEIALCLPDRRYSPALWQIVQVDFEYLSEWLEWPRLVKSESDLDKFIESSLAKIATGSAMANIIEYKGEVAGVAGFNSIENDLKRVEIGYWLASRFQRQGIMTRVCKHLIDYAFNELLIDKVHISVAEDNAPSRQLCKRLGMYEEGRITNEERVGDRILNHVIYGLHKNAIS